MICSSIRTFVIDDFDNRSHNVRPSKFSWNSVDSFIRFQGDVLPSYLSRFQGYRRYLIVTHSSSQYNAGDACVLTPKFWWELLCSQRQQVWDILNQSWGCTYIIWPGMRERTENVVNCHGFKVIDAAARNSLSRSIYKNFDKNWGFHPISLKFDMVDH